jgi:hypothetical protein
VKTIVDAPAFERASSRFDLRLDYGTHVHLFQIKPSIVWHSPDEVDYDAVDFPIATEIRVPVLLGYKVESIL